MVFGDKPLSEVSNDELRELVAARTPERQDLEFKATVQHSDPSVRLEILKDIAAMANAGGGYFIVGISEQGGRASGFARLSNQDVTSIRNAIVDWTIQDIRERIFGIESDIREVEPGSYVVMIRIPASVRAPHMVTYGQSTIFVIRHGERKREMTIGEIRDAFTNDLFSNQLTRLQHGIRSIEDRLVESVHVGANANGDITVAASPAQAFNISTNRLRQFDQRLFWIAACPRDLQARSLDLNSTTLQSVLSRADGSRRGGWTVEVVSNRIAFGPLGELRRGDDKYGLRLFSNGYMDFVVPLEFFNKVMQPEEFETRPSLWPFPVCEFPSSFVRLYGDIVKETGLPGPFSLELGFFKIRNAVLLPGHPNSPAYSFPLTPVQQYPFDDLLLTPHVVSNLENPDKVAHQLIVDLYNRFGHSPDAVPFYDDSRSEFVFS